MALTVTPTAHAGAADLRILLLGIRCAGAKATITGDPGDSSQTAGYVSNINAQFHDFEFNLVKPYDDGLSHVGLLILFNQGKGCVQTLPAPTALVNAQGYKFNCPKSLAYYKLADQDLTTILSDQTYITCHARQAWS